MHGKILNTIIIAAILTLPIQVSASGTQAADFLNIDVSALQASFGGAGAALSDDITASYYNPAGLSMVGRSGINFMHNLWYQDISYEFLGSAFALNDKSTLAISTAYLHMGEIMSYDESNQQNGSISAYSLAGIASYSYCLSPNISLGLSAKYITEKLDDVETSGYAFDLGLQYHHDLMSFGAVLNNVGPKVKYENESFSLPTTVSLGASYAPFMMPVKIVAGARVPFDGKTSFSTGVEYSLIEFLSLRTGIGGVGDDNVSNAFNIGAGFKFAGFDVDYAFNPGGDLGQTHFFSFNFSFGKPRSVLFDNSKPIRYSQAKQSKPAVQHHEAEGSQPETNETYIISTGNFTDEKIADVHVNTLKEFGVDGIAEAKSDGTYYVVLTRTEDHKKATEIFDELHSMGIDVVMNTE